jgi:hypothetical protein
MLTALQEAVTMFRAIVISIAVAASALAVDLRLRAEETLTVDPAKVAQLKRLEPLTAEKVEIFVQAGRLTQAQAALVKKHIGPKGQLELPEAAVAPERPRPLARRENPTEPPREGAISGPYAEFRYQLEPVDRERLLADIREYRVGSRSEIGRHLRGFRPEVNELIAAAYKDPIDLPVKIALWEEVAGPANPDAAIGLFETHRAACELARSVLVPHFKDIGGVIVRRALHGRDAGAYPSQRWFASRDLRDMIIEIEGLIARCQGPSAAIFLMSVYSKRYDEGEAAMRDKGRDRHCLVQACGADPKKFDQDEPETWNSKLTQRQRAIIAERLIPWLSRENEDRARIARNGLQICLPAGHPKWEAGRDEWDRWWTENKDRLLAQK